MKILIITKECKPIRRVEEFIKHGLFMDCLLVTSIEQARLSIATFLPHLVLCSVTLEEECDGVNLIVDLRKQYNFETILLQSVVTEKTLQQALAINPLHILIEPIDLMQLYSTLRWTEKFLSQNNKIGTRKFEFKQILSRMEYDVLKGILSNKSTKQIAEEYFISPYTVKNHRHNICKKLELGSGNNSITKWALENGVLSHEI